MKIDVQESSGVTVVTFEGKITIKGGDAMLRDAVHKLIWERKRSFVLDLQKTERVDSSGLGAIVGLKMLAERRGGRLVLSGVDRKMMDVLEITRLSTILVMYDTLENALRSFS